MIVNMEHFLAQYGMHIAAFLTGILVSIIYHFFRFPQCYFHYVEEDDDEQTLEFEEIDHP